jgi:hypothetical protein
MPVASFSQYSHFGVSAMIIEENDQVSAVPFEITNTIRFFFTGFECKKEAVSMFLADIFKTALHGLEADRILPTAFTRWFFRHDHVFSVFS